MSYSTTAAGAGAAPLAAAAAPDHALRDQESSLLQKALLGHTEAFGRVFSRHQESAFGLALYYTRNREDARDLVQDAFVKALLNLRRFDLRRDFGPWLMSIVRNLAIDLLRKRKVSRYEILSDSLEDRTACIDPERRLACREVWNTLSKLDPKHREIILLKDYFGYSYLEISRTLGIPLGTVMSRLHQSRKRFRMASPKAAKGRAPVRGAGALAGQSC